MPKSQPFEYVDRDIRRDEILTQDGYGPDERWTILVRALTVVVGRAETAEIMAWSKQSIETVAKQFPELSHLVP